MDPGAPTLLPSATLLRPIRNISLIALAITTLGASFAPGAGADPIGDKRAQAAMLEQQIASTNEQISALGEKYNGAIIRLQAAQAQLDAVQARIDAAQAE